MPAAESLRRRRRLTGWLLALSLLVPGMALAGRDCRQEALGADDTARAIGMAVAVRDALHARGIDAAVIARSGQDLREYGLHYSHAGFVYRSAATQGHWRVIHKLNRCSAATGELYRHGLADFFSERPWRYRAKVAPLREQAAQALIAVADDERTLLRMHTPAYNVVSYPWSTRYQQSNEWLTETLAAALDARISNRRDAQAWLASRGFAPRSLRIDTMQRLGAQLASANVYFDDHPLGQRMRGDIRTTTVADVVQWLQRSELGDEAFEVTLER